MKVGIVGSGVMGSGIAQAFAQIDGFEVVLTDIKLASAEAGKEVIKKSLLLRAEKGKIEASDSTAILGRISTGVVSACKDCDLVVEAVIEDIEAKKQVFKALDTVCKPECIFATNTSSLSITQIGNGLKHHVIGMHFFNPAPIMKLVEVIAGLDTPEETVCTIFDIVEKMGKTPVEVAEGPAFVVNRVLAPMINEAIGIYADGLASVEGIDTAIKLGANQPMGPLALGDLIGLDVVLAIMDVLYHETGDSKYRAHMLLRKMVRGGKLGIKTGEGFYAYNN